MQEDQRLTEQDRLAGLGAWVERLADPAFSAGSWVTPEPLPDGTMQLGYVEYSPGADAFRADCGRLGWVQPFDWMTWAASPEGRRLAEDRDAVAAASPEDLGRLLTAIIRSDRFTEGSLAGAFESGLILAIARRARVLAEAGGAA